MKKILLSLLAPLLLSTANAATTTNETDRRFVKYTLFTITEKSNWVKARTRGVSDGSKDKTTRYAVVTSYTPDAIGDIVIQDTLMVDGNRFPVMSISEHAFENARFITSISMPDRIDEIGACAFKGCSLLKRVTVQTQESGARATSLNNENGTQRSGVRKRAVLFSTEEISRSAFEDCINLEYVRLPSGIKKIGWRVFANCESLKSVSFTNDVQTASVLVKYSHSSNFGQEVFAGCSEIETVYADRKVSSISDDTFDDKVYTREHLSCPEEDEDELKSMGGWKRFFATGETSSKIKTVNVAVAGTLSNYISDSEKYTVEELTITGQLNGTDFRLIRDMGGSNYLGEFTDGKLRKLNLSGASIVVGGEKYLDADRVHFSKDETTQGGHYKIEAPNEISENLFAGCQFEHIDLPENIVSIKDRAFMSCKNLKSIAIPEGVLRIGNSAFNSCEELVSVSLPSSLTEMGRYVFAHDRSLESIAIPYGVKVIHDGAFWNCRMLGEIKLPEGLETIGMQPFENCVSLTEIVIPATVNSIGLRTFYGCTGLRKVTCMAQTPISIHDVFDNYDATLYVPKGSKSNYQRSDGWRSFGTIVELNADDSKTEPIITFADANVKRVCVANWDTNSDGELSETEAAAVTSLKRAFYQNEDITTFEELSYFTGLKEIWPGEFAECTNLRSIKLPNNVEVIGYFAFSDCASLEDIVIPDKVMSIDSLAFNGCANLEKVTILNPEPIAISEYVFQYWDEEDDNVHFTKAALYVPYGSKAKYQSAEVWKNFTNIVEMNQASGKTLTLMVNRCEREYGEENPKFTYTTEGGSFTGEPAITCEATKTSPVGIYPITISKGSIIFDGKITFIDAKLSVTRATLTVTADDKTMIEGAPMPELTVTYSGFKNGESEEVLISKPTLRTTGSSQSREGTYPIYVSGAMAENYRFDYIDGKLTIKKEGEVTVSKGHTLVITFTNGQKERILLSEEPRFVVSESDLVVKSSRLGVVYQRADIYDFTFEEATDISAISNSNELSVRILPNGDVAIGGVNSGSVIKVYNLNGRLVSIVKDVAEQEIEIPLSNWEKGVYLININNSRTIKILNK